MLPESGIAENQIHSSHYLKSVVELGDNHPIHTIRDIYSARGVKLLNAGMHVNSSVYDRLLNHKLISSLDECLETDNSVSNDVIVADACAMLAEDTRLQKMMTLIPNRENLISLLAKIPLNHGIAFKLTVMRSQRNELFQHSLFIMLVSTYIGIQVGLDEHRLVQLATAALLHDIGIMHIDPNLLDRNHRLTDTERHHLYAHPLTAWMILREYTKFPEEVNNAVLQHHERLDGSGYPQGLRGGDIGQFGQIIAVAEIVGSRYGKPNPIFESLRLETILKLNSKRYGRELVGYLEVFFSEDAPFPPCSEESKKLIRQHMFAISAMLSGWEPIHESSLRGPLYNFIDERIQCLKIELLDAGLNPYAFEKNMLGMEENPRACAEASILLDEAIWQMHAIIHEIKRRWPSINADEQGANYRQISDWLSDVECLLGLSF